MGDSFDSPMILLDDVVQIPTTLPTPKEVKKKAASLKKVLKADKVYLEDYEKDVQVKSFVVKGDTKVLMDQLKELGGRWNSTLGGWIFSKTKELEIAAFLKKNA